MKGLRAIYMMLGDFCNGKKVKGHPAQFKNRSLKEKPPNI
jgi:hypothetical protein